MPPSRHPAFLIALTGLLSILWPPLSALAQTGDSPATIPQADRLRPLDLAPFDTALAALTPNGPPKSKPFCAAMTCTTCRT